MVWTLQQFATQFRSVAGEMRDSAVDLMLPASCRVCNESVTANHDFCDSCLQMLLSAEAMMTDVCRRCGRPSSTLVIASAAKKQAATLDLAGLAGLDAEPSTVSGEALAPDSSNLAPVACRVCGSEAYEFDDVVAMWPYHEKICEVVVASKYSSRVPLADALGRRLGCRAAIFLGTERPDLVTYVPSHFMRQAARGGTSARVIAEGVASILRVKCQGIMKLTRRISKQAWLDDATRVENVREAFSLRRSHVFRGLPELTDRHILLVDDVLTTGATASELSRVLRAGGARKITLAVVARALRT